MKKHSSKTRFRKSLGAICKNPRWSWSWVNHEQQSVYFGASNVHENGDTQLILGLDWELNKNGTRRAAFSEAMEYIKLIKGSGYTLLTYRQIEKYDEKEGRVKITAFEQDLERRHLIERGDGWHAVEISDFQPKPDPHSMDTKVVFLEGSKVPIVVARIERNTRAREACLKRHGTRCCICNFEFKEFYGDIGDGFIHVHHLTPISESKGSHEVNPETDLRPVCPNCHAMIHRGGMTRSIEEVRELISKNRT